VSQASISPSGGREGETCWRLGYRDLYLLEGKPHVRIPLAITSLFPECGKS
jgi:hypothetical protein